MEETTEKDKKRKREMMLLQRYGNCKFLHLTQILAALTSKLRFG